MKKRLVTCHDIKGKKYNVVVDQLNFRPAVFALIFREKKILLCRLWDGYDFPGGGVQKGELLRDALKREVREETGIAVQPDTVVHVCEDFFISFPSKRKLHSILIYYLCKNPRGRAHTKNFEEEEKAYMKTAKWVDVKDVSKIKFYNGVNSVKLIQDAYTLYSK
ncbi:MAG: NUDIX hydrolase [Candidatus Kerfeldbacteria bacterium]|nr:NUDIX hydrolase [Candidatus Kerfeldbacteria bacterium]